MSKQGSHVYSRYEEIPRGFSDESLTDGCLVLEGGAFRGMYTMGVLDVLLEYDINLQTVIGVSAGALCGLNYMAGQIGRSARANLGHRFDRGYVGGRALLRSGSLINLDFLIRDFNEIEPLHERAFTDRRRRFVVVATNCENGETEYFENGSCDILTAVKASASMPYVSPMVEVDGKKCLDGGCSKKIPLDWALEQPQEKIVVILTRERGFRKQAGNKPMAGLVYHHYPQFAEDLRNTDGDYNRTLRRLEELEQEGRVFVIAPSQPVTVGRVENDIEKLGDLYQLGRQDAREELPRLASYLGIRRLLSHAQRTAHPADIRERFGGLGRRCSSPWQDGYGRKKKRKETWRSTGGKW